MEELERVAIHTVPRSGSTWLGAIFDSSPQVAYRFQPLFSYGHKDQLNTSSSREEIDEFFHDILNSRDDFVLQTENKELNKVPVFSKDNITHLVYKEVRYHHILENLLKQDSGLKAIAMIRNPKSVIASWLKAPKEFRPDLGWSLDEWYNAPSKNLDKPEEFNGFTKWCEASTIFLKLKMNYPDRFKLIHYSDLLNETEKSVRELFDFVNLSVTDQTLQFISNSQKRNDEDPYGIYKKKVTDDSWKNELDQEIIQKIDQELVNTPLEQFLR
ncbi:sulfotransferase domain-containing protein [bacterium]|nr:sulfotransferase domain-containing protein [bacterium]